jgi:filamentous hemagglutinin
VFDLHEMMPHLPGLEVLSMGLAPPAAWDRELSDFIMNPEAHELGFVARAMRGPTGSWSGPFSLSMADAQAAYARHARRLDFKRRYHGLPTAREWGLNGVMFFAVAAIEGGAAVGGRMTTTRVCIRGSARTLTPRAARTWRATSTGGRWKVGEYIYNPTARGEPSWSTVRSRYWKNQAAQPGAVRRWGADNVQLMRKGRAPQRYNPDKGGMESMELSHEPIPQREGGTDFVPRWPQDHATVDPYRHPGY